MIENDSFSAWLNTGYGDNSLESIINSPLIPIARKQAPQVFQSEIKNLYTTDYSIMMDEGLGICVLTKYLNPIKRLDLSNIKAIGLDELFEVTRLRASPQIESFLIYNMDTGEIYNLQKETEKEVGQKIYMFQDDSPYAGVFESKSGQPIYTVSIAKPKSRKDLIVPFHEFNHITCHTQSESHRSFYFNPNPTPDEAMEVEADVWMFALSMLNQSGLQEKIKRNKLEQELVSYMMFTILTRIPGREIS